jgi:VWFA-related protein
MGTLALLAFLAAQTAPATDGVEVRSLTVTVTDDKGNPVDGLAPEEVALLENGVLRDLTALAPDTRPLAAAVLVDTSAAVASSFRLSMVDSIDAFLKRLPMGSTYALWTTGDRPTKVVDYTDDTAAARKALTRVAPQGGNTMLDAIVEASRELKQKEGARTAVVVVTAVGVEFSSRDRYRVVEEAQKNAELFLAVQVEEGESSFEERSSYNHVLGELTKKTGGLHETTLSSMGVDSALRKLSAQLRSRYRLSYATVPQLKSRKIELKVARPGVKVRVGPEPLPVRES